MGQFHNKHNGVCNVVLWGIKRRLSLQVLHILLSGKDAAIMGLMKTMKAYQVIVYIAISSCLSVHDDYESTMSNSMTREALF